MLALLALLRHVTYNVLLYVADTSRFCHSLANAADSAAAFFGRHDTYNTLLPIAISPSHEMSGVAMHLMHP